MKLLRRLAASSVLVASGVPVNIIADELGATRQDRLVLFGSVASVLLVFPLLDVVLAGGERTYGSVRDRPSRAFSGRGSREAVRFRRGRTGRRRFAATRRSSVCCSSRSLPSSSR